MTTKLMSISFSCSLMSSAMSDNMLLDDVLDLRHRNCVHNASWLCAVQCAMRCVKWGLRDPSVRQSAVFGSISHFLPRMETRGRPHQQMGAQDTECNTLGPPTTRWDSPFFVFTTAKYFFRGQLFHDLIRSGNSLREQQFSFEVRHMQEWTDKYRNRQIFCLFKHNLCGKQLGAWKIIIQQES